MSQSRNYITRILLLCAVCLMFVLGLQIEAKAAVKINKSKVQIYVHDTEDLRLINATGYIKWKSSNTKVAYVDIYGRVYGMKAGKTKITAKYGNKTYTCAVTVSNQQDVYGQRLIHYINYEREKFGMPPVQKAQELNDAATKRSKELATRFRTTRLNGSSPFSAISVHYPWKKASQLIARRYLTPKEVVEAWSRNKTQHATMLRESYNVGGTACYLGKDGNLYWVAFLAKK